MLLHLVLLDDWSADPDRPYAPPSLADEGFTHCSPDEPMILANADRYFRDAPGALLVLVLDEARLRSEVRWEESRGVLFPHVHGPVDRDAVTAVLEVRRDADGRARELVSRS
ncbi:DUF952 domain-containing protein [Streptomyces laurentii]|uniref:DUF952 domain-containing protein n=1 Tax=Streptomyces laurentii TaxID=39478 RepID=UPI0036A831AE